MRIEALLHSPAVSPAQRAALYRVLARLPGVEFAGETSDPAGRRALALTAPAFYAESDEARRVLFVDPETAEVLAVQTVLHERVPWVRAEPPVVIQEIVYLESGWVDSVERRPGKD